jgi:hypothetical protein
MSWRCEILTDQWMTCGLRFATKEEAEANVADLAMRWTMVTDTAVEECDDPVNYRWVDGKLVTLQTDCDSCGVELESDPPHEGEFDNLCHQCNADKAEAAQVMTQQSLDL